MDTVASNGRHTLQQRWTHASATVDTRFAFIIASLLFGIGEAPQGPVSKEKTVLEGAMT
ncbi:hypothetical protein [Kibdelosporangium philippinense]|uniref:hypothetical protein n=1 Tax=Kibdelosporangium philippinense TaxID=211113 RepID=UPI003614958F